MATISDERLAELLEFAEYKEAELISDGFPVAAENWADLLSVLTEVKSLRSQAGASEAVAWQDITPTEYDPDAPPCHSADNAAMFILDALAKQLGLETYTPADGSETWEGDVLGTMHNILVSAGIWDDYNGRLYARPAPIEITEEQELTQTMARSLPGGQMDDSSYSAIEDALDAIQAPMCDSGGRFLTLVQRIAAIQGETK